MNWTRQNRYIKNLLIITAFIIAGFFLFYSHILLQDLKADATSKMEVWAEAMRTLNEADENTDLNLVLGVLNNNNTIPIIVVSQKGEILQYRNIQVKQREKKDSINYLKKRYEEMKNDGYSIRMDYNIKGNHKEYIDIYYEDSLILKRLAIFPYIQIAILFIFVIIIIITLLSLKRAEQNRVWVGLTKETAHQLGTPISSLMAWTEILRDSYPQESIIDEINKDVNRLQLIADRFSKVGSKPELIETDVKEVLWHVVGYISNRFSNRVHIKCNLPSTSNSWAPLCAPLFEWVIENLCKNAIDAMEGHGLITITMHHITDLIVIEVSDTGKGIPKNNFKNVFAPGYTTKKRGWGLGLSLSKRIIEEYHGGIIYVKNSEIGQGTTFRIELKPSKRTK